MSSIRPVEQIDNLVKIKTAVISVNDKSHLDILVRGLIDECEELKIYSSGGTYNAIAKILGPNLSEVHLCEVSEYTGQPETEGGLVKTLHHKLFLGYLTETYCDAHQKDLEREHAVPIDLVVMNLYPFRDVVNRARVTPEEARGNIDVGGPSALRAAAKNYLRVMTLPYADSYQYEKFLENLAWNDGGTDLEMRLEGCQNTFKCLSEYDADICKYFKALGLEDLRHAYEVMPVLV